MKSLRKKMIIGTIVVSCFANIGASAIAEDKDNGIKVAINGKIESRFSHVYNSDSFTKALDDAEAAGWSAAKKRDHLRGVTNDTRITLDFKKEGDLFTNGAVIELNADTSHASDMGHSRKAYMYTKTPYGRFEVGSMDGPATTLKVGATSLSRGTGGIDGVWRSWAPYRAALISNADVKDIAGYAFINKPTLLANGDFQKKPNRVSWYGPENYGFSVGLSVVPSVNARGDIYQFIKSPYRRGFKNIIEGAVAWEQEFTPHVNMHYSLAFERGDSTSDAHTNLRSFELGALLNFYELSLGLTYGNFGSSGIRVVDTTTHGKNSHYAALGASYQMGPLGASMTWMSSRRSGGTDPADLTSEPLDGVSKLNIASIGMDYALSDTIKAYLEYNQYTYKQDKDIADLYCNDGGVMLAGLKMSF